MNEIKGFAGTDDENGGGVTAKSDIPQSNPTQSTPEPTAPPISFSGHLLYVHECGNQPKPSVEKGNWDGFLFGHDMGDRSRIAYWVNRHRYAFPLPESAESNTGTSAYEGAPLQHPLDALAETVDYLCPDGRKRDAKFLLNVGKAIVAASGPELSDKGDPARGEARQYDPKVIAWLQTNLLPELHDYFFDKETSEAAERTVQERIAVGAGPYVILAHGLGSIVAYNALRALTESKIEWKIDPQRCRVQLFLTMGSPLGLSVIANELKTRWGDLKRPDLVDQWADVRNARVRLSGNTVASVFPVETEVVKPLADEENSHSSESYLRSDAVKNILKSQLGMEFGQEVADFRIAKDIALEAEDASPETRHEVLIEYADLHGQDDESDKELAAKRSRLTDELYAIVGERNRNAAEIAIHRRFVSARLTRQEMERLAAKFEGLNLGWIWRDAAKASLLDLSGKTVQALPARVAYGATGRGIAWAVLDTGVDHNHRHFKTYGNVVDQWDCTKNVGLGEDFRDRSSRWDRHGHGTHVAATIAGYSGVIQRGGNDVELHGMAPETQIYSYKVLADNGSGRDSFIIRALDDIAAKNERNGELMIHGVNLSLGGSFDPSVYGCGHSPICRELRRLWRQGVVVCLAAGNEGLLKLNAPGGQIKLNRDLSIADPANLDVAIAVGSSHKSNPHTFGISHFSSRGPTADGRAKPDLVAPGERILSARTLANPDSSDVQELYVELSGTSMACPHVSGVIAAFLSQRREFIGYPERVKKILLDNCTDLERDIYFQGRGMPNLVNMLLHT